MSNPKKKPKLTDLELKDVRIKELESEIQMMRKAYIKKQEDIIVQSEAMMRLYQWKVDRMEKDRMREIAEGLIGGPNIFYE
jgi:hypothetical protein